MAFIFVCFSYDKGSVARLGVSVSRRENDPRRDTVAVRVRVRVRARASGREVSERRQGNKWPLRPVSSAEPLPTLKVSEPKGQP